MPRTARASTDALPEFYQYADNGCEVSPSCLNCPLPQCKDDDPIWYQEYKRNNHDMRIVMTIRAERLTIEQAAQRFSVTPRTIFRVMRRCRETLPGPGVERVQHLAAA